MEDDAYFQSQEELEAHYGPGGPVVVAQEWLRLVVCEQDLLSAWELTDPNFRLVMTQAWTWANKDHPFLDGLDAETVAKELAEQGGAHPLWGYFEQTQLAEIDEGWDYEPETWGAASRPRPTAPDHELVIFMDTGGEAVVIPEPTLVEAIGVVLRSTPTGWLVVGTGTAPDEGPRVPRWPPSDDR
jgi:hypothetical protein